MWGRSEIPPEGHREGLSRQKEKHELSQGRARWGLGRAEDPEELVPGCTLGILRNDVGKGLLGTT